MLQVRWIIFLAAAAGGAWFTGAQFRPARSLVYAKTNAVAYTAEMVHRTYDAAGVVKSSWTAVQGQRGDGSSVLVKTSYNGQPLGIKRIVDTAIGIMTTVDPQTQSRATYRMNPEEVERRRSPNSVCQAPGTFRADAAPGEKILGWDVVHFIGSFPGDTEKNPVERWVAPGLNCLTLKEVASHSSYKAVLTVEKISLGEPASELFEIPATFAERRPSEILSRASEQQGLKKPNTTTAGVLDQVYDSRREKK